MRDYAVRIELPGRSQPTYSSYLSSDLIERITGAGGSLTMGVVEDGMWRPLRVDDPEPPMTFKERVRHLLAASWDPAVTVARIRDALEDDDARE